MGGLNRAGATEKPGDIKICAANAVPFGWLKANGAQVSRAAYPALDAAIGQTYGAYTDGAGAAGTTHLVLPDARGEFIRGWDDGRGVDTGRVFGSLQNHALQSFDLSSVNGATPGSTQTVALASQNDVAYNVGSIAGATGPIISNAALGAAGSTRIVPVNASVSNDTRPRNVAMLICIKY